MILPPCQRAGATGRLRRAAATGALVVAFLSLASCRTPKLLCFAPSGLKGIGIRSDLTTNGGNAVAVDLLFVTRKDVLDEIGDLKSRDYFAKRDLLMRKFRKGWTLWEQQLEPGQYVGPTQIRPPCNREATLVFAAYADRSVDATLRIDKAKRGTVILKDDGIAWMEDED